MTLPVLAIRDIVLASRQRPNHPYSIHDVVSAGVALVGVAVGDRVVVSRHPPNHPYLTQDVLGNSDVEVELVELVELEVVVSSRHPKILAFRLKASRYLLRTPPARCLACCSSSRNCCG